MYLKGKLIVFLICDIPGVSDKVVEEIEQMVKEGARVRAYLIKSDAQGKIRGWLKDQLNRVNVLSWEEMILTEEDHQKSEGLDSEEFLKDVDLLVVAPCPSWLWKKLVAFRLPERVSLVVAPVGLDAGTRDLIYYLGDLIKKERTYFVPFGPVSLNPEKAEEESSGVNSGFFLSRMDLLRETTMAAVKKCRIEPYIFELDTLPQ